METNGTTREELATMQSITTMSFTLDNIETRLSSFPNRRDFFAAAAMNALLQTAWGMEVEDKKVIEESYSIADEMIKQRNKHDKEI